MRVALFLLIFLTASAGLFADVYYLAGAGSPGIVAMYGFAALFAVILGTPAVFAYMLPRMTRRLNVERCPMCRAALWDGGMILFTVATQRCPECRASLRDTHGFPVRPRSDQSSDD